MFIHNFKYALKTLLKNKMLIFWTFAFPIILGSLFKLAFSNIENTEKFDIIDIAIVENEEYNSNLAFKETFKVLSDKKNKDRLFNTSIVSEEKAKKLLDDDKIEGYLLIENNKPQVIVADSGISETILKYVTEEITQSEDIVKNVILNQKTENGEIGYYEQMYAKIQSMLQSKKLNIKDVTSKNLSYTMIEFYTLIAMTCMYGGMLGMVAINNCLPNMSEVGKRVTVSPTPKWITVLSSVLAGYITQLIGLLILFIFTIFALKVDYGKNIGLVIALTLVGALAGLTLGVADATIFTVSENSKTGIIVIVSMVGSFLSGMMGITMKYVIDKNVPIVNIVNPCNMITDGFYALYYYDTLDRFIFNIVSLFVFSIIMVIAAIFGLRRCRG